MPRVATFNQRLHSLHFTPHQLHPSNVLSWSADAMGHAVFEQLAASQVELIEDHKFGFVYVGWKADWVEPFGFRDSKGAASLLEIETGLTMYEGKRDLLRVSARFSAGGKEIVTVDTQLSPLKMTGGAALDGVPDRVPASVRALLKDDEIEAEMPPTPCNPGEISKSGELVGQRVTPFVLYRHEGEVADMWQNPCLASLDGRAREAMAFDADGDKRLKDGLARPIRSMSAKLRRPLYMHESGEIHTSAYWNNDHLAYVHEVYGAARGGQDRPLCATIVVEMAARS